MILNVLNLSLTFASSLWTVALSGRMCGTSIRWTGDDKEKFSRLVFDQKVIQISHLKSRNQPCYCNIKDLEAESVSRYVSLYLDLADDSAVQLLHARFYLLTCIVRCRTSLFAAT